ncbi:MULTISPECIES: ATP-binding protein [unclassified Pseudonocardia]|uniref:ATP-binding protein n=1 Tax=unclassified Pseudonocardia TaxID=2619320 RepID=UPI00094AB584|nr:MULTISPECIES: ATP-binding protein [unclassified Pseudonocardia]
MSTPTTTAPDRRLVHRAVPYRDPEHQAEVLAGPVGDALDQNRRALVVVEQRCRSELQRSLGSDAGVRYCPPERMHSAPPFTVAGRWSRAVRDAIVEGAPGVCTVGQPLDLPGTDPAYWTRLDLALDHALHGLPVEMLCCFADDRGARAEAGALHDEFLVDGDPVPSEYRRDHRTLLAENPQAAPADLGVPLLVLPVGLDRLSTMRRVVHRQAVLTGFGPERAEDLVLAVNELVSNGIEHGSGGPVLRMWRTPEGLVAEMTDPSAFHLPFPGLAAPSPSGRRGRGMWMASELTDVLQVWTAEDDPGRVHGTVVRVTAGPP